MKMVEEVRAGKPATPELLSGPISLPVRGLVDMFYAVWDTVLS